MQRHKHDKNYGQKGGGSEKNATMYSCQKICAKNLQDFLNDEILEGKFRIWVRIWVNTRLGTWIDSSAPDITDKNLSFD